MKPALSCLALLILVSAVSLGTAAEGKLATASGKVVSVDAGAKSLVVNVQEPQGDPHDMTFTLDEQSKIVKDGAAIAPADLKSGDTVTVTYKQVQAKYVVVNVGVSTKPMS